MLSLLAVFGATGYAASCSGIDLHEDARHCITMDWNARNANGDGYLKWCDGARSTLFLLQNRPHTAWGGPCRDAMGHFDGDHALAEECVCKYCLNRDLHNFPINPNWMSWPRDCAGVTFYCGDRNYCGGAFEAKDGTDANTECTYTTCSDVCCQPKTYCESYTCVGDRERADDWRSNTDCRGDCDAQCCQDKTFCSSYECKRGQTKIAGSDDVDCAGDCQANCCEGEPQFCYGYTLNTGEANVCRTYDWNRRNLNGDGYVSQCNGGGSMFLIQNRPHTAWGGKCHNGPIGAFDGDHFKAEECICTYCTNRAWFQWPINPNWANWPRDCDFSPVLCSSHTCDAGTETKDGTDGNTDCGPDGCQATCCQEPLVPTYGCDLFGKRRALCPTPACEFVRRVGCQTPEGGADLTGSEFCAAISARRACDGFDQCMYRMSDRTCITTDGLTQSELCGMIRGRRNCERDPECAFVTASKSCILAADNECSNYNRKGQCNANPCINGVACSWTAGACVGGGSC